MTENACGSDGEARPASPYVLVASRFYCSAQVIGALALSLTFFAQPTRAQLPTAVGWTALPSTTSLEGSGECPANNFGGDPYPFASNCANVIRTWNGAIADTTANRLIIWGGGHSNYFGNEIYSLNLKANPISLTRLKDPTIPTNYANRDTCVDGIPPGSPDFAPNSRETYEGLAFLPSPNRMLILDGSLACTQGHGSANTWTIPLNNLSNASSWVHEDLTLAGTKPNSDGNGPYGNVAAYDPNSGLVFVADASALYTYNYSTNTYTQITSSKGFLTGIYLSGAIDPTRKLFVLVGACSAGSCASGNGVFVADISDPSFTTQQNWTAATLADPDCAEFLDGGANPINASNPGITFDSVANDFVGWPNEGNSVYILTPDPANKRLTCQKLTFANGPPNSAHANNSPNTSYGTFGRFQYFPALDVFVLVNDWNIPAYILRLRNGVDFTLSSAPSSASVNQGSSTAYTVSVAAMNGFSGSVNLSVSGLPPGATATFNPPSIGPVASSTLTVKTTASAPAGSSTLTITGTSGSLTHTAAVTLNVTPAPSFTLTAAPSSASATQGATANYSVTVTAVNGFSGSVNLSVSGLPPGATATFNPPSVAAGANSTLAVKTATSTPPGSSTLTIAGTSNTLTATTTAILVVTSGSSTGSITFVQGAYNAPQGSSGSVAATFPAPQTAGNLNVLILGWNDTTAIISSVTDSAGNAYDLAAGPTKQSANVTQLIYYARSILANSGENNTVTVTFNIPASYPDLRILEYAGADSADPLDVGAGASGTSATASASLSTTNANDLIVAGDYIQSITPNGGAGFTVRMITKPNSDIVEDESVSATGTYSATAPLSSSGWWVMNAAAFRVASDPPDTQPPSSPTSLSASAVSATQINLSWTASTDNVGVTGYKVDQCQGANCSNFVQVGTTSGSTTTYSATGLTASTAYSYRVRATDAAGNLSNYSNTASATTQTGPPPSVTFVQGAYNAPQGSFASVAATFAAAQDVGDLNIVVIGWNDTTATVKSVTDSKGNIYTLAAGPTQLSGIATQSIYYAANIATAAANANTVTVAFNSSAAYPDLRILEYSGAPASNPIDAVGGASGTSTTPSATLTTATTNANDLILAADYIQTTTPGPGAGFTTRIISQPDSDLVEDKTVAATGTYTGTAPQSGNGYWVMSVVAIK